MKIKVLSENTAGREDCPTEHGLSLYIETATKKILFDMGASSLFAENARRLAVDLAKIDFAVVSHGHDDHGGGIDAFLCTNSKANVYISKNAFEEYFNGAGKFIGLRPELRKNPRIVLTGEYVQIDENTELFSCNARRCITPINSFGLTRLANTERLPDDFQHEQYLLLKESGRRILFSGCSHKGVLNIEEWFSPDVLIGGFHFMKLNMQEEGEDVLQTAAQKLLQHNTVYYTCHCTGTEQYNFLKNLMNDRLHHLSCGDELEI